MPTIEVTTADKDRALRLVEFVKREFAEFPLEARFVFAVEMSRMLKPEVDELKRRQGVK